MLRNTHLYENRTFKNNVRYSIVLGQKEKALGTKRKSMGDNYKINLRKMRLGHAMKLDQNCRLILIIR